MAGRDKLDAWRPWRVWSAATGRRFQQPGAAPHRQLAAGIVAVRLRTTLVSPENGSKLPLPGQNTIFGAATSPAPYPDLWQAYKFASAGPYRDLGAIQITSAKQRAEGPLHTSLGQRPRIQAIPKGMEGL